MADQPAEPAATEPAQPKAEETPKTFSEEQVNRIVGERLNRERAKIQEEYGDLSALKASAGKFAEIENERKSEIEKAQERAAKLEQDLQERDGALTKARVTVAVLGTAGQKGITDPDAATKLLDWSQIEYDDNGQPENVADLLDNLVKEKPYLVGTPTAPNWDGGPRRSVDDSASPEEAHRKTIAALFGAKR